MNLSELLAEQGSEPLTAKVNGVILRAFINANLKRVGVPAITKTTPSETILETIYGLDDESIRDLLLNKEVSEVKGFVNYKRILSFTAVCATVCVLGLFIWSAQSDGQLTVEETELIKTITHGIFNMLVTVFTGGLVE